MGGLAYYLLQSASCANVQCLQGKTVPELIAAQKAVSTKIMGKIISKNGVDFLLGDLEPWTPTCNTTHVPKQPFWGFVDGDAPAIPTIMGTNRNEGMLFIDGIIETPFVGKSGVNYVLFKPAVREFFCKWKGTEAEIEACYNNLKGTVYPPAQWWSKGDRYIRIAAMMTDGLFTCPALKVGQVLQQTRNYHFYQDGDPAGLYSGPNAQFNAPLCGPPDNYICHGAEIPYVHYELPAAAEEKYKVTSRLMQGYWANFTASANKDAGTAWPHLTSQAYKTMVFNGTSTALNSDITFDNTGHHCTFWNGAGELNYGWIPRADEDFAWDSFFYNTTDNMTYSFPVTTPAPPSEADTPSPVAGTPSPVAPVVTPAPSGNAHAMGIVAVAVALAAAGAQ